MLQNLTIQAQATISGEVDFMSPFSGGRFGLHHTTHLGYNCSAVLNILFTTIFILLLADKVYLYTSSSYPSNFTLA